MQGRSADPLDQRLDRLISRGRELVDGVSGARPGGRPATGAGTREGEGRSGWRHELDGLGRWVENRIDRLLDDEANWREPWQEDERAVGRRGPSPSASESVQTPATMPPLRPAPPGWSAPCRRPLEAISRRGLAPIGAPASTVRSAQEASPLVEPAGEEVPGRAADSTQDSWPDDALFEVPRWSRPLRTTATGVPRTLASDPPPVTLQSRDRQPGADIDSLARPLPRSSRRRSP